MSKIKLAEFQGRFKQLLLSPVIEADANDFLGLIQEHYSDDDDFIEAKLRLAIYRNNVIHSLMTALGELYPVVKRLIGDDCFNHAARKFVRNTPPAQAALVFYGQEFSEFIKTFTPCIELEFLADVAALEFFVNQAYHSGDSVLFDPATLSEVAPEQLGNITFSLIPSVTLMRSDWPIDSIWHENLKVQPELVDLSESQPCSLMVYRRDMQVEVVNLDPNCFLFLSRLQQGLPISVAWSEAVGDAKKQGRELPDHELSSMLGYLFGLSIFSRFSLSSEY
ncbi:DNA-binding domain-containing protein [Psychrobium sp. 1_MG-2023]|uniref:HvfC/BufC N-terminal domain-containing protein n=1 Tax=Psychrobium sp. 1_MG-2023 TaxID=3062624 RepID=UPI000C3287EA|nr:DNA-binding domain-containing protein [Psychrobium sp. 1_MG-2023]MDP2561168.1 DNA-binding domain-containing protein [Psychrobium sp. 1_MG-2023]PKF55141.1 hypothetical protein CW748_14360 [Alteromonadales bacterium alter-6D02]